MIPAPAKPSASALLAWYARNRRDLPWRAKAGEAADPYAVWLSEIMLQQTTVAAVAPYYERFLARWPDVQSLAAASLDDVMKAWAGLGYYARARNLHACARLIAFERAGRFPRSARELERLPGIGPYASAAIAAIAFNEPCVALDGNVARVVSRLFAISMPVRRAQKEIRARAETFLSRERPGDFAQALMDLGALLCPPRKPACGRCPFRGACMAAARGEPEAFPVRQAKTARPKRAGAVFVLRCGDLVLLRTRALSGLLGGMAEFPASPFAQGFDPRTARAHAPVKARWRRLEGAVAHIFSHFSLELTVFVASVAPPAPVISNGRWAHIDDLEREGLPGLMRKAAIHAGLLGR